MNKPTAIGMVITAVILVVISYIILLNMHTPFDPNLTPINSSPALVYPPTMDNMIPIAIILVAILFVVIAMVYGDGDVKEE
jgi:hypothetical protein